VIRIDLDVTKEQVEYGKDLACRVFEARRGNRNIGEHAQEKPQEIPVRGFIGETVAADLYGKERPVLLGSVDEGYDFEVNGFKVDVKSTWWGYGLCLPKEYRFKEVNDGFLLVNFNRGFTKARVQGFVTQEYFKENHVIRNWGWNDTMFLSLSKFKEGAVDL